MQACITGPVQPADASVGSPASRLDSVPNSKARPRTASSHSPFSSSFMPSQRRRVAGTSTPRSRPSGGRLAAPGTSTERAGRRLAGRRAARGMLNGLPMAARRPAAAGALASFLRARVLRRPAAAGALAFWRSGTAGCRRVLSRPRRPGRGRGGLKGVYASAQGAAEERRRALRSFSRGVLGPSRACCVGLRPPLSRLQRAFEAQAGTPACVGALQLW